MDFASVRTVLQRRDSAEGVSVTRAGEAGEYADGRRVAEIRMPPVDPGLATVTLLDVDGQELARRRLLLTVEPGVSQVVTMIIDRRCAEVDYPPPDERSATECSNGVCASPECSPRTPEA